MKLSVIYTGSTVFSIASIDLNVNKIIITKIHFQDQQKMHLPVANIHAIHLFPLKLTLSTLNLNSE